MSNSNKKLSKESCEACSADAVRLTALEEKLLLQDLPLWDINTQQGISQISRVYAFDDFQQALNFANQVGEIAETVGHHPAVLVEWGKVKVTWWSHEIAGLHKNDFIMASRTDDIFEK